MRKCSGDRKESFGRTEGHPVNSDGCDFVSSDMLEALPVRERMDTRAAKDQEPNASDHYRKHSELVTPLMSPLRNAASNNDDGDCNRKELTKKGRATNH